jgi:hypothetical protein
MQLAKFGHTGLTVSRLCRGTATFGKQADEPESHRILDVAADAGINFLDTAYFCPMDAAHAQTRVRKRLKKKAGADVGPDSAASGGSDRGAGAEAAAGDGAGGLPRAPEQGRPKEEFSYQAVRYPLDRQIATAYFLTIRFKNPHRRGWPC